MHLCYINININIITNNRNSNRSSNSNSVSGRCTCVSIAVRMFSTWVKRSRKVERLHRHGNGDSDDDGHAASPYAATNVAMGTTITMPHHLGKVALEERINSTSDYYAAPPWQGGLGGAHQTGWHL